MADATTEAKSDELDVSLKGLAAIQTTHDGAVAAMQGHRALFLAMASDHPAHADQAVIVAKAEAVYNASHVQLQQAGRLVEQKRAELAAAAEKAP
jgi:hypothetical protein